MPVPIVIANGWSSCHGGSSTSLIDIVTNLDPERFAPIVICPEPGELPERLRAEEVRVEVRRTTRLAKETLLRFGWEVLWHRAFLRREGVRLVHANVGGARSSLAMAAITAGVPYLQHVRNPINNGSCGHFGFQRATRVLANSNAVAGPLFADVRLRERAQTVYNAVDLRLYDSREDRRHELPSPSGPIIGFVGQIVRRKGVKSLIEAMPRIVATFPQSILVVVGCSPPDECGYEMECLELAQQLGIANQVVWTGYRRDVPAWMRTFDVFALPTRSEPFGKVVIEAMASGCPVVATNVGGIPEIVSDQSLGTLIPPDDPEALASAILAYLEDRSDAVKVGKRAAEHVRAKFGVDRMVREIEGIYEDVIAEHTRAK